MTDVETRPHFSEQEAISLAASLYGITATASPLPSYRDQNFRLFTSTGETYVLKIACTIESWDVLVFQNKAMTYLAAHSEETMCSRVCTSLSGNQIEEIAGEGDSTHYVRLLTYLPGKPLAKVNPHTPDLLHNLGRFLGTFDQALFDFDDPGAHHEFHWDLKQAHPIINRHLKHISDPERRSLIEHFLRHFETVVLPILPTLRQSVIQNDGNDYNVLVEGQRIAGLIDFGDMVHSYTVAELAIAAAYAIMDKADPLAAASHMVRGYHEAFPLTEVELEVLFPLICMRLCVSVAMSAYQQKLEPDNEYLTISERPAWALLEQLKEIPPAFAHYTFRHACGLSPCPKSEAVVSWLNENQQDLGAITAHDLTTNPPLVFDLSVGSLDLGNLPDPSDMRFVEALLFEQMRTARAPVAIGRYNEARIWYNAEQYGDAENPLEERRTIHLGIDVQMEAGAPIYCPLDGIIHSFQNNDLPLDYGPTIIVEHTVADDLTFYTLYGHLSVDSLQGLRVGQHLNKGDLLGRLGARSENGGWPPHLHFQIITDLLGQKGDFPGVAKASQRAVWLSISPDPNLILGIPESVFPEEPYAKETILDVRRDHIGRSLSISYSEPLKIVRGARQYLYDETGRAFLDGVNNVCHVGHCHPRVVRAAQRQMAVLNTNTRYLHDNLVRYAQRLTATMPDPLRVCFFVNSGSEANDLALRLARAHTGQKDTIILDAAYHGNLTTLIEISPYKHDGRGGKGAPPHVHNVGIPDPYRGPYKGSDPEAGKKYAEHVEQAIEAIHANDKGVAAFIAESLPGCGGQIVLPDGYLEAAYQHVRAAGGVCIADEVQVGFGRVGSHFWGFELQGVVPDIVTLGKPIGNGHPLGAVITTPAIAASFNNGMEYFNTFGGNPVSCAVGLAVLDIIEEEKLQEHAYQVGNHFLAGLEQLMDTFPLIGDVRGRGLYLGAELVRDRKTLEPAAEEAAYIINRLRDHGMLLSTDGPLHNVLKIKPPLVFTRADADRVLNTLDKVFAEDFLQRSL